MHHDGTYLTGSTSIQLSGSITQITPNVTPENTKLYRYDSDNSQTENAVSILYAYGQWTGTISGLQPGENKFRMFVEFTSLGEEISGKYLYFAVYYDDLIVGEYTPPIVPVVAPQLATCSIALESPTLVIPNSQYGAVSDVATQNISNAGSASLSTIEVRATDWTIEGSGDVVSDIHSEVKPGAGSWTDVTPGSSVEITTGLPTSDANSKLPIGYRVDMSGNAQGPSGTLSQTVTYIADCS